MRSTFFTLLFFWFSTVEGHVVVFGGEHEPAKESWKQEAFALGQYLAKTNVDLITGGAPSGLMRAVADGFVAEGPTSTLRAIVRYAYREDPVHPDIALEQIRWPKTRHACLEEFFASSNLFIVLPGGLGTILEFFDCLLHNRDAKKTLLLLNLDGYWDPILEQIQRITNTHERAAACTQSLFIATSAKECIEMLQSRCFYLQGASRSGKSTICQQLKTSSECCVVDSLYPAFLLETLATNYPQECAALQDGLDNENIRHALTRDLYIFKITATEEQKKGCQQAIKTLQRAFSDPKTYAIHQENFRAFSREKLQQGTKTAPYLFTTDGKEKVVPFSKNILFYCPLEETCERLLKENASSLSKGKIYNYRFLTDVFISFFSFYEFTSCQEGSIDVIEKSQLFSLFDSLEPLCSAEHKEVTTPFFMPVFSKQDLEAVRKQFLEWFQGGDTLYVIPKKHYDFILHTKDLSPEEITQSVIAFARTHSPKIAQQ